MRSRSKVRVEKSGIDDSDIVALLTSTDRIPDKNRLAGVLDGEYAHSTALPDLCLRKIQIMRKFGIDPYEKYVSSNDRLIWATGLAFEDLIRVQFTASIGHDNVFGDSYTCKCGAEKINLKYKCSGLSIPKCDKCGTLCDNYNQLVMKLDKYGISSEVDFGYYNATGRIVMVETKSMKKEQYLDLKRPIKVHIRQAVFYANCAIECGYDIADYVMIIYASKGVTSYTDGPPYKAFKVKFDKSHWASVFSRSMFAKGKRLKEINKDSDIVEMSCSDVELTQSRSCEVSALCFSLGECGGCLRNV